MPPLRILWPKTPLVVKTRYRVVTVLRSDGPALLMSRLRKQVQEQRCSVLSMAKLQTFFRKRMRLHRLHSPMRLPLRGAPAPLMTSNGSPLHLVEVRQFLTVMMTPPLGLKWVTRRQQPPVAMLQGVKVLREKLRRTLVLQVRHPSLILHPDPQHRRTLTPLVTRRRSRPIVTCLLYLKNW